AEGLEEGMAKGLEKGRAEGRAEGLEEGIEKGEKMKSIAIAKELKAMGLDDDAIMRATRLSASDLSAILNK
ncbi:MAG: hypothetical protein ACI31A_07580, partial [Candidatus Limisoma sp.]